MKTIPAITFALTIPLVHLLAQEVSLESAPPVVVRTVPVAGGINVNPALTELRVTYSKPMQDGSWSWARWGDESFPETSGSPFYQPDGKTCVLPVRLQPNKFYAIWLNSDRFTNFKDFASRPAVPYLLTFTTAERGFGAAAADSTNRTGYTDRLVPVRIRTNGFSPTREMRASDLKLVWALPELREQLEAKAEEILNTDQRAVIAWTDRQFRSYFDNRTFEALSDSEKMGLEARLLGTLKGPENREYYQAINTLAALRSPKALAALREIAFSRLDKNNRDRWMAVRGLGLAGDAAAIPDMIHLVYHGNTNTRWWAQISLVRLTGQNFGTDWKAWRDWWNSSGGEPPCPAEVIRWWNGQSSPEELPGVLAEADRKFLSGLKP